MTDPPATAPKNANHLSGAIARAAARRGVPVRRIQGVVGNTILGQLLPDGVVKGGTGLKLRLGESASRFTPDLDAAFGGNTASFEDNLATALAEGWGDFTGRLVRGDKRNPDGLPEHYVMQPYEVKMQYRGRDWLTVDLELGHAELDCTDEPDLRIPDDIVTLFTELGLPAPVPIPVMALRHQVAQKLHACTYAGSDRAHDLVDLQLLMTERPDLAAVCATAERLFRFRQQQPWPPRVTPNPSWDTLYNDAAEGLSVLADVTAAAAWGNELIESIVEAGRANPPSR